MATTARVFDHRGRAKRTKPGTVEIRVTNGDKVQYICIGVRVLPSQFKYGMVVCHSEADELNERIGIIHKMVEEEINAALKEGRSIDIAGLRCRLRMDGLSQDGTPSFLNWCEEQLGQLRVGEGTRKHYRTTVKALVEFGKMARWEDVTAENIYRWDAWLHARPKRQSDAEMKMGLDVQNVGDAAVFNHHKRLKALLNRAVLFGVFPQNPYNRLKGQFKRGVKENVEYLTEEEMEAFESLRPVQGTLMAVARDLFVLQMYTGLAFADVQNFSIRDYRLVDGRYIHIGERVKTGTPYVSQLLPPAVDVLERYNWKVPKINNADYNHALKALGMAAGISIPLHSHLARHTFATYMLRNGVRIENVSKMLGHTNITQTQRYAKVLAKSVHEEFDRIYRKLEERDTV